MNLLSKLDFYKGVLTQDMVMTANSHWQQFQLMVDTVEPICGEVRDKNVLDIGCGRLYPYTLLLHSLGNRVVGVDIVYIGINGSPLKRYWSSLMRNGVEGFSKDFLYALLLKNRTYYNTLRKLCGFPLDFDVDIRQMNTQDLLFPDEIFDVAISNAVFEHVRDVSRGVSELSRTMKKGGIAYVLIHLFASLSGGHHYDYANSSKVPPWDHLRQGRCPVPVYLNRLREEEYLSLFREEFDIMKVIDVGFGEGKEYLTAEIRAELKDYSEEELLKGGIIIVAQKL